VAYGKGQFKDAEKRVVDLGRAINSAELTVLRTRYIVAFGGPRRSWTTCRRAGIWTP